MRKGAAPQAARKKAGVKICVANFGGGHGIRPQVGAGVAREGIKGQLPAGCGFCPLV